MRWCFILVSLIASPLAVAVAQDEVSTQTIYACASIASDADRLVCYDDAVGRFREAEVSGAVATISKSNLEELNRDSFGFSLPSIPKILPKFGSSEPSSLNVVIAPVEKVSRLRYDNLRIELENGQIWEQTDGKRINFSKNRRVKSAEIKRAALGSYKMKLDGGRSFRAKRIQ